jgi:hypothetical protein
MKVSQNPDMIFSCLLLFVFVGHTEYCNLENFGSSYRATTMDFQMFEKKQTKLFMMQGGC